MKGEGGRGGEIGISQSETQEQNKPLMCAAHGGAGGGGKWDVEEAVKWGQWWPLEGREWPQQSMALEMG